MQDNVRGSVFVGFFDPFLENLGIQRDAMNDSYRPHPKAVFIIPYVDYFRRSIVARFSFFVCVICIVSACSKPDAAAAKPPVPIGEPPTVVSTPEKPREIALLAGGCFWGMEDILRKVPGVIDTEVGYTGGSTKQPVYEQVKTGRTGHAEAIMVTFDPKILSFESILETWFFRMHDPTTLNRQGNDIGTQYRSAIFYLTASQKAAAERVIARVTASGVWRKAIVTQVIQAGEFTPAERYHQDYLKRNPGGYTCHYLRTFQTPVGD